MSHTGKATLVDVARAAEVSRSTVSNVFAHPERVRKEVRAHVEAKARELGYLGPDPKGRILRAGKINAIGVIPPAKWGVADSLRNPVFDQLLQGIGEVCDEVGASLLIMPDRTGSGGVSNALVDGFIFGRIEQVQDIDAARLRRLPFVVMDIDAGPDISSVRADSRGGGYSAARHLTNLGHRRFGILSFLRDLGPPRYFAPGRHREPEAAGMATDQEKYRGYADALAEVGIDIGDVPMVQAHPWETDAARLMLDMAPEATAILSMSVMQGIAVVEEAQRRSIVVPRDLSVVGFNDIPAAAKITPPLTTVDGMGAEKGRIAAQIVLSGSHVVHEMLPTRLVIRSSTAAPPPSWRQRSAPEIPFGSSRSESQRL
jgi:DNA-binding LacI/PurR family transcriptional regulator